MNNMAHNYLFCQKNGGCDSYAYCTMTGPLERNCTCRLGFIGDGESCKGTLQKVRSTENKQAHKWNNTLTVSSTHFSFLGDPKKKCWKCLRGTVGKLNLLFTQSCFLPWDCDLTKDSFLFFLQRINPELGNRGPFTVFLPNSKAYKPPEVRLECCTIMEKKLVNPLKIWLLHWSLKCGLIQLSLRQTQSHLTYKQLYSILLKTLTDVYNFTKS